MFMLAYLQIADSSSWVGPTMAISLAVIALCILGVAIGLLVVMGKIAAQVKKVGSTVGGMQDDVKGTIQTVRHLAEQGQELMVTVRHEAGAFAQTSRRMRRKLVRGMDRVEERLEDLDALYSVVHEEVEDTALDVAAAMRSIRDGDGMISRVRRMLVPSR